MMRRKTLLVGILLGLGGAIAGCGPGNQPSPYGSNSPPPGTPPGPTRGVVDQVTLSSQGATPKTLVRGGSQVTFRNTDTRPHLIASRDCADLNGGTAVPAGGSVVLTIDPNNVLCTYYDALNPGAPNWQGQIVAATEGMK